MAYYFSEPSHTFNEYLLVPGYSSAECMPANVSLRTPIVKFKKGEQSALYANIPMVSAIMQAVSDDRMAIALAQEGGISFIFGSQSIESEAAMVARVKSYKAGFIVSDSNVKPETTLAEVLALKERTGHSTMAVTDDGTANGKLLGIVTSRDYRVSRMSRDVKVEEFMTPFDKLITAPADTSLKAANDIIWDHKLNSLPLVDDKQHLVYMVFRKDYDSHKANSLELLDQHKRYVVGAGINTRDYAERVPALVEAGADVLCIDSSEGFSEWQSRTLAWVRAKYGDDVKVGAGNVVDREGFRFLAEAGADFIKVGIGGGSICITREQKGIGRGQATALIEVAAARDEYFEETGIYIPICSDGGIVHDYHCTLALAMGADFLMLGRYFSRFDDLLSSPKGYRFETRSRRPPLNEVNAVLSFVYTLLAHDVRSSMEAVGLDPAAGYLHTLRPGRLSFALDIMEELRAPLCDRLVISMFNRDQFQTQDFTTDFEAVYLSEKGRRKVLEQWRARKHESIQHPFLKEKVPIGMIPYVQSMLFARVLRRDLDRYPPFVWRS